MRIIKLFFLLASLNLFSVQAYSTNLQNVDLTLPKTGQGRDKFFVELLTESLAKMGYHANIKYLGDVNYNREMKYLDTGQLSLTWRMKTELRDRSFQRIDVPLTNSLMAQRILLIPKDTQQRFNKITNLSSFRESGLVGIFHEHWLDKIIWQQNNLQYIAVKGEYKKIFRILASQSRGVDYFSRSIIEILDEQKDFLRLLDIEEKLLFQYEADFYFYLGNIDSAIKNIIISAIKNAQTSGLLDNLINKYWGHLNSTLTLNDRIVVNLKYME